MPNITAGRLAEADKIRSYDDIITIHHGLCGHVATSDGRKRELCMEAAARIARVGRLYQNADEMTDQIRELAYTAIKAVHNELCQAKPLLTNPGDPRLFAASDSWLDQMSLVVNRPADGR